MPPFAPVMRKNPYDLAPDAQPTFFYSIAGTPEVSGSTIGASSSGTAQLRSPDYFDPGNYVGQAVPRGQEGPLWSPPFTQSQLQQRARAAAIRARAQGAQGGRSSTIYAGFGGGTPTTQPAVLTGR